MSTLQIVALIITVVGLVFAAGVFVGITRYAINEIKKHFDSLKIDMKTLINDVSEVKTVTVNHEVRLGYLEGKPANNHPDH